MSCQAQCFTVGGPWVAEDPNCPEHGVEAQAAEERRREEEKAFLTLRFPNTPEVREALRVLGVHALEDNAQQLYAEDGEEPNAAKEQAWLSIAEVIEQATCPALPV